MSNILDALQRVKQSSDTMSMQVRTPQGDLKPVSGLRNITELSHTMIGEKRLNNIRFAMETLLDEGIGGDFVETEIWRGGACIFIRGILKAYDVQDRTAWAADSFEGVPAPSMAQDANFDISKSVLPVLAVPIEEVKELFQRYGLLDDQIEFLQGWFKDTLGQAPIEKIAMLRLDGDLYESTMDELAPLYDKV
jgi:O-methyltransferase